MKVYFCLLLLQCTDVGVILIVAVIFGYEIVVISSAAVKNPVEMLLHSLQFVMCM